MHIRSKLLILPLKIGWTAFVDERLQSMNEERDGKLMIACAKPTHSWICSARKNISSIYAEFIDSKLRKIDSISLIYIEWIDSLSSVSASLIHVKYISVRKIAIDWRQPSARCSRKSRKGRKLCRGNDLDARRCTDDKSATAQLRRMCLHMFIPKTISAIIPLGERLAAAPRRTYDLQRKVPNICLHIFFNALHHPHSETSVGCLASSLGARIPFLVDCAGPDLHAKASG